MYKKVADAQYRSKLSNELMMYHMKVSLINALYLICITFFESHEGQSETFFVSADILNPFK